LARFAVSFAVSFARRLFFSRLDCYPNAIDQGLECLVMDQQRRSSVPMIISTAGYIPEEIRAHMYDGIPGVTASRTSDSPRRRRKTLARDPMGREIGSYEEEDAVVHEACADHRPGFRTTVTAADHARVAESYNQMVQDLQTQWMSPEQKAAHVADAQRVTADARPPAGVSAAEFERARMCSAWKRVS
jgi:hypothetical protein